jgi:hypothetical protein
LFEEARGFVCTATASLKVLEAEALERHRQPGLPEDPRVQVIRDPALALPFLRASGWFGTFIHQVWRSHAWSESLFQERYLEPGHCLGILEDGRLRALAAGGVLEACAFVPPGGARALTLLDALGWHSWEREEDYLVYELPLEKLAMYRG